MTATTALTLAPTEFLDHTAPEVTAFVERVAPDPDAAPDRRAVALYYAVRDEIRYEVYGADLSRRGLRASQVLRAGSGMCLHKSVVYAAALRACGIPARLVLTDVRNHLTSPRLRDLVGGDVFHYHCLTSVHLGQKWMRVTPVFNRTLCRLFKIAPLEFDGSGDSVYHPYDLNGRRHMEFLHTHGEFPDLPYDLVIAGLRRAHPRLFAGTDRFASGSLVLDHADSRRDA
ncbi:transglutaminase-like domain-containing protein [Actinocrispum sp. NPDC049592]|uniref:transglutaminase-like domain-containing protein n=1 Tax=Actinocrispum sp. NPDC049592 TaxID=3154835 RepID=UPI003449636A